jgi:hypothetical protein
VERLTPPARILLAALVLNAATSASAQEPSPKFDHPVAVVGGDYGSPTRLLGTAGILIATPRPATPGSSSDSSRVGLLIRGAAGTGGFSMAAGAAALAREGPYLTTGFDALVTVTRTGQTPAGASINSTYVGVEGGLVLMSVRLSAGVAHRTAGAPGPHGTIFTWSVGVQIPLGW